MSNIRIQPFVRTQFDACRRLTTAIENSQNPEDTAKILRSKLALSNLSMADSLKIIRNKK